MPDILYEEDFVPRLAQKRIRVFAAIVDYIVLLGFFIFMGAVFGERYTPPGGGIGFRLTGMQPLIYIAFWFLAFPFMEGITGQTLGKMLFKIKVVSKDFSYASFAQAIARRLFDIVDWMPGLGIVGLLVASNNNNKQRVGDLVAKTVVIIK